MRIRIILAFLSAAALLAACMGGRGMRPEAGPGGAQAAGAGIRPSAFVMIDALLLTGFDADHDARIDEDELTQGITREFSRADENGDGSIAPLDVRGQRGLAEALVSGFTAAATSRAAQRAA